jgi:hypothetical protein
MKKTPTKRRQSKRPKPSPKPVASADGNDNDAQKAVPGTLQASPQGDEPRLRHDQTPPLYPVTHEGGDVVIRVPVNVCEFGQARIVGREWGPDNNKIRGKGWAYWLVDSRAATSLGRSFLASEEEVGEWQRS